jgi:hypothetical protein
VEAGLEDNPEQLKKIAQVAKTVTDNHFNGPSKVTRDPDSQL